MHRLDRHWDNWNALVLLLLPLAGLFSLIAALRRFCYRIGPCKVRHFPVPVIVVGNITVGGTGKTPLVIWLAQYLRARGWRPGIVSRGYGGKARHWPQQVRPDSDPVAVGDEAVLLAAGSGCPVCAGPDRPAAVEQLLHFQDCNIIISDDGLQHYALGRDIEIVVIDGARRFGNGLPLPAGPLREPVSRLHEADLVVVQGSPNPGEFGMSLTEPRVQAVGGGETEPLEAWRGREVHAVAGIGNPQRFFNFLRDAGLTVIEHPFPDHHIFQASDLAFGDQRPVLMTAKDAVKCRRFGQAHHHVVTVQASPETGFIDAVAHKLEDLPRG